MSDQKTRVEGIYYNSADTPVFLEGKSIGGHDYVFLEGYLRIPGHFVHVEDPYEDPDAPETFRVAYSKLMEKGKSQKTQTHSSSSNQRSNVIPATEVETEKDEEEIKPATKPVRASRRGKRETASDDKASQ